MPKWGYSIIGLDPDRTAVASGRELRISPKAAREICRTIRGMKLDKARSLLLEVIEGRTPIPYKRHRRKMGHRRGLQGWDAGRFPEKAASAILGILDSVESNAEYKGLSIDDLRIIHAATQRARKIRKYIPRAFGRSSPYFDELTHVEVVVEETL
jgi:large subunit ribosomal protein L22